MFLFFLCLLQPRLNSGTMSVSEKLRTYPSLSPTLTLTYYQLTVTGLGEGYVGAQLLRYWFWSLILIILVFSSNRVDSVESLTNVSTQTLKLHMSCVKGLHHHVPILFDYYHFAVIDTTIHATVTALGLPDHR